MISCSWREELRLALNGISHGSVAPVARMKRGKSGQPILLTDCASLHPGYGCNELSRKLLLDEGRNKTRHRGGEIGDAAHQMDRRQFRLLLPSEVGLDPGAQRFTGIIDLQNPDHRNGRTRHNAMPIGLGPVIVLPKA